MRRTRETNISDFCSLLYGKAACWRQAHYESWRRASRKDEPRASEQTLRRPVLMCDVWIVERSIQKSRMFLTLQANGGVLPESVGLFRYGLYPSIPSLAPCS